jgi:hypothetical protein
MLSDKYLFLASSRTYPGPQGIQASLIPGAGDRIWPVVYSSQMDSLRTALSIQGGIYTSLLLVHVWLNQQV